MHSFTSTRLTIEAHDMYMVYICRLDVGSGVATFYRFEYAHVGLASVEAADSGLRLSSLSTSQSD
jgi:hypothetical protein